MPGYLQTRIYSDGDQLQKFSHLTDWYLSAERTALRIEAMREILTNIADSLLPTFYRVGSYLVMTLLDDPAILALGFC